MNTYLTNSLDFCCGFNGTSEDLIIEERLFLVKEDGSVCENYGGYKEGETYTAKKFWVIRKSYRDLARFDTKEKAQAEFDRILKEIGSESKVVVITNK